jgi:hypothetical protein
MKVNAKEAFKINKDKMMLQKNIKLGAEEGHYAK